MIQPKWHPRYHHDHESWNVDGDYVIWQLSIESHVDSQTAVDAWKLNKNVDGDYVIRQLSIEIHVDSQTAVDIWKITKRVG